MSKQKDLNKEYHSFQEFLKKFYPSLPDKQAMKTNDPDEFGAKLAQQSLIKLKQLLSQR